MSISGAARYRQFLKLCERWPRDTTKAAHRDLAAFVREKVLTYFNRGEATEIKELHKCDVVFRNLEELVSNKHKRDFPCQAKHGVLGFELKKCQEFNSDEFIHGFNEYQEMSAFRKFKEKYIGSFLVQPYSIARIEFKRNS